jgi:type VI protein secretion system component Hcp
VKTVANGTAAIYMQWRFNDARFTSVQCDGDEQNEPGEKIKIVYSGLEVQYKQQKQDGSMGAGLMAAYSSSDNAMTTPTLK